MGEVGGSGTSKITPVRGDEPGEGGNGRCWYLEEEGMLEVTLRQGSAFRSWGSG